MQTALDLRSALLQSGGCAFTAEINVDYGQTALRFCTDCTYQTDGRTHLLIDSPETLAGISAYTGEDGAKLRFSDTVAAMPLLDDGRISPLSFAYLLGSCLSQDYISCTGSDGGYSRITYLHGYDEDELTVDVFLDENAIPMLAEVSKDGQLLLAAELRNFTDTYEPITE